MIYHWNVPAANNYHSNELRQKIPQIIETRSNYIRFCEFGERSNRGMRRKYIIVFPRAFLLSPLRYIPLIRKRNALLILIRTIEQESSEAKNQRFVSYRICGQVDEWAVVNCILHTCWDVRSISSCWFYLFSIHEQIFSPPTEICIYFLAFFMLPRKVEIVYYRPGRERRAFPNANPAVSHVT